MDTAATAPQAATTSGPTARQVGTGVAALFGVAFVVVAWLWVPWETLRGLEAAEASDWFDAEHLARVETFADTSRAWSWSSLALSLVAYAVLASRWGLRRLRALQGGEWWRIVAAVAAVTAVVRLVTLPFAVGMRIHRLDAGISVQGWGSWAQDVAVGWLLNTGVTAAVVLALLTLVRLLPRAWPAVAATAAAGFVLAASLLYPVVVEPLFSEFEPLPDGELRTAVLEVAEAEGVEVGEVLVADASARTTALNAYVSGLGSTRRVVLYDSLVADRPLDEVMTVVAHEVAHAAHDDVLVGTTLGALGIGFGVGLLGAFGGARLQPRAEVVPVVLLAFAVATQVASPVQSSISRAMEVRADLDALRVTDDPQAFIAMQTELAARSLNDPTPVRLAHFWWGTHPTTLQRIQLGLDHHEGADVDKDATAP